MDREKGLTPMIWHQRLSSLHSPLRVDVTANKPEEEDEEESAQNRPFDYYSFLS